MAPVGLTESLVERIRKLSPSRDLKEAERILNTILYTAATLGSLLPPTASGVPGGSSNTTLASIQNLQSVDDELTEQPSRKRTRIAEDDSGHESSELQNTPANNRYKKLSQGDFFAQFSRAERERLEKRNQSNAGTVWPAPSPSYGVPPSVNPVSRIHNNYGSQLPSSTNIGYLPPQHTTAYHNPPTMRSNLTQVRPLQLQHHTGISFQPTANNGTPRVKITIPSTIPQARSVDREPQHKPAADSLPVTLRVRPEKLRSLAQTQQSHDEDGQDETQTATMDEDDSSSSESEMEDIPLDKAYVRNWDEHIGLENPDDDLIDSLPELETAIQEGKKDIELTKQGIKIWKERKEGWNKHDDSYKDKMDRYEEKMGKYEEKLEDLEHAGKRLYRRREALMRK